MQEDIDSCRMIFDWWHLLSETASCPQDQTLIEELVSELLDCIVNLLEAADIQEKAIQD